MALTILTGSSQAAATNYSYRTSGSSDWSSVPTSSNFYDVIDKVVRYKTADSQYVNAITASFAATASRAITAATATSADSADQLVSVNRGVTEFQTTDATPYVQNLFVSDPTARYIKAIVIGNSNSGSLGGEFTKFYDVNTVGSGTTQLLSTGTLADNIPGTPTFSISGVAQWTATGVNGVNIDWRVIIEYSDYATGF